MRHYALAAFSLAVLLWRVYCLQRILPACRAVCGGIGELMGDCRCWRNQHVTGGCLGMELRSVVYQGRFLFLIHVWTQPVLCVPISLQTSLILKKSQSQHWFLALPKTVKTTVLELSEIIIFTKKFLFSNIFNCFMWIYRKIVLFLKLVFPQFWKCLDLLCSLKLTHVLGIYGLFT